MPVCEGGGGYPEGRAEEAHHLFCGLRGIDIGIYCDEAVMPGADTESCVRIPAPSVEAGELHRGQVCPAGYSGDLALGVFNAGKLPG